MLLQGGKSQNEEYEQKMFCGQILMLLHPCKC